MTAPTTTPEVRPAVPPVLLAGTLDSPAGMLHVVVDPDGVVRAAGYGPVEELHGRLAATLARTGEVPRLEPRRADELPGGLAAVLDRYADGDVGALDAVAVAQPGGLFHQAAWEAMRRIPAGRTRTYAEVAREAGRPRAVRAAGTACARNLVAPFVPCHRVVRTDGTLGGYAYGLAAKEALLAHERRS